MDFALFRWFAPEVLELAKRGMLAEVSAISINELVPPDFAYIEKGDQLKIVPRPREPKKHPGPKGLVRTLRRDA